MRLSVLVLGLAVALAGGDVFAAGKKKGKGKGGGKGKGKGGDEAAYVQPYGMAGCGLGSIIMKDDTTGAQITAGTSNGTGFQTSALSCTGSSNCEMSKADLAKTEQDVFIATNLHALEKDVSEGGGPYADALAQVFGCTGPEEHQRLLEVSRASYGKIFGSGVPETVAAQYRDALRANKELATGCERVIL